MIGLADLDRRVAAPEVDDRTVGGEQIGAIDKRAELVAMGIIAGLVAFGLGFALWSAPALIVLSRSASHQLSRALGEQRNVRDEHTEDEQAARDDLEVVLVERAADQQRAAQAAIDERRQDDADDRSAPAEDRHPAEQHDRDHHELEADADVLADRGELEGVEHADQRADHTGEDEEPHLHARHANAGVRGGLLVEADRVERAPKRRAV